jgi:hypothetical protein
MEGDITSGPYLLTSRSVLRLRVLNPPPPKLTWTIGPSIPYHLPLWFQLVVKAKPFTYLPISVTTMTLLARPPAIFQSTQRHPCWSVYIYMFHSDIISRSMGLSKSPQCAAATTKANHRHTHAVSCFQLASHVSASASGIPKQSLVVEHLGLSGLLKRWGWKSRGERGWRERERGRRRRRSKRIRLRTGARARPKQDHQTKGMQKAKADNCKTDKEAESSSWVECRVRNIILGQTGKGWAGRGWADKIVTSWMP